MLLIFYVTFHVVINEYNMCTLPCRYIQVMTTRCMERHILFFTRPSLGNSDINNKILTDYLRKEQTSYNLKY